MLSIVIPTKNEEEYLPKLLASIAKQTLQPLEVIVADAFSTDKTRQIAASFGAKVVDGGMPGPGRNRGAEAASGEVLLFLDADVQLNDPQFLERNLNEFVERKLAFATCDVLPLSGKLVDRLFHDFYNAYTRALAKFHPHAPGFCIFARRAAHNQIHGFDETVLFCEDHDYVLRGQKIGAFGILTSVKVPVSVRRLDRDGRVEIAVKYALAEAYIMALGPVRSNIFNYTFGHKHK